MHAVDTLSDWYTSFRVLPNGIDFITCGHFTFFSTRKKPTRIYEITVSNSVEQETN